MTQPLTIIGSGVFHIRFNTLHGETDLHWRVLINDTEYLVRAVRCEVTTYSDAYFDKNAGKIKYHMAGSFQEFSVDEFLNATFR